jgi:hypothetical protein
VLQEFLNWILGDAPQGHAAFLGNLTGSLIGLIALLLGALFNAHLNRRHDIRLRRHDQRAMAAALKAELVLWSERLEGHVQDSKDGKGPAKWMVPVFRSRVLEDMIPKLGYSGPLQLPA